MADNNPNDADKPPSISEAGAGPAYRAHAREAAKKMSEDAANAALEKTISETVIPPQNAGNTPAPFDEAQAAANYNAILDKQMAANTPAPNVERKIYPANRDEIELGQEHINWNFVDKKLHKNKGWFRNSPTALDDPSDMWEAEQIASRKGTIEIFDTEKKEMVTGKPLWDKDKKEYVLPDHIRRIIERNKNRQLDALEEQKAPKEKTVLDIKSKIDEVYDAAQAAILEYRKLIISAAIKIAEHHTGGTDQDKHHAPFMVELIEHLQNPTKYPDEYKLRYQQGKKELEKLYPKIVENMDNLKIQFPFLKEFRQTIEDSLNNEGVIVSGPSVIAKVWRSGPKIKFTEMEAIGQKQADMMKAAPQKFGELGKIFKSLHEHENPFSKTVNTHITTAHIVLDHDIMSLFPPRRLPKKASIEKVYDPKPFETLTNYINPKSFLERAKLKHLQEQKNKDLHTPS